jgi:hypothetical protein
MRVETLAGIAARRRATAFLWVDAAAPLPWLVGIGDVLAGGRDPVEALGTCLLRLDGDWRPPADPTEPIDREVLAWLPW